MTIPHLFMCPISLDLIKDPVTLCTGQTYDRSSIEKWISSGNLTCPVTMQKLHDPITIIPNHALRHLIHQWLNLSTINSLSSLKNILESQETSLQTKIQSLVTLLNLSQESSPTDSCLLQLGFLPLLLELVLGKVEPIMSQECVELALSLILRLLSFREFDSLNVLKEESKLESFQVLMKQGSSKIKSSLCHLIEEISASMERKELCALLGESQELLKNLVALVSFPNEASEDGVKAISALCSLESNRESLVREGAISGLISYISNAARQEKNSAARAMASIEILLGLESAKEGLINEPNGVTTLVKMVFRVCDHEGSESAVRSLIIVCSDSLKARQEAICGGVLSQLLLLLQSQCGGRTKTKARMLLKLLRSKWDEEPKHL